MSTDPSRHWVGCDGRPFWERGCDDHAFGERGCDGDALERGSDSDALERGSDGLASEQRGGDHLLLALKGNGCAEPDPALKGRGDDPLGLASAEGCCDDCGDKRYNLDRDKFGTYKAESNLSQYTGWKFLEVA